MSLTHVEQDLPPRDEFIDFESALVWFDCERCKGGTVGQPEGFCEDCSNQGVWPFDISTLLANLAVAGALESAFNLGCKMSRDMRHKYWRVDEVWRPGCQRPAPGHALTTAPGVGEL